MLLFTVQTVQKFKKAAANDLITSINFLIFLKCGKKKYNAGLTESPS